MLLRVILISVFLGLTLLVNTNTFADLSSTQNILYLGVIVLTYLITISYSLVIRWRGPSRGLANTQLVTDLLIAAILVAGSGGYHSSPFLFTLYLPVIAGAFVSELRTAIFLASGAAAITILTTLVYVGILPAPLEALTMSSPSPRQLLLEASLNISFTYLLAWSSGQLARQLGQAKTEIARSHLDIKNLQTLNEDILASLNSGLLTIDASFKIIFFNRAAEDITGLTLDSVFAKPLDAIFPSLAGALKSNPDPNSRHEFHYDHPHTEHALFLGFSSSPLRDAHHARTGGFIIIFQDLSTFRELEILAKRNEKLAAIGQLSAAIAHEIRNPLASISGSVEMLQSIATLEEDEASLMDIILREVERLNTLISEFLNYSRPHTLMYEATNVIAMLEETLQLFRHHSRSILVSMDVDDGYASHVHPHIDREAVRSVVWNLLVNAAQAMNAPERSALQIEEPVMDFPLSSPISSATDEPTSPGDLLIDVRLHMSDDLVHITIEDNGEGISQADSEHIFEPFFTTKESGTGLGLATAFRIIDEHGGQMTLQAPRRLQGASFELTIPKNLSPTKDHTQ